MKTLRWQCTNMSEGATHALFTTLPSLPTAALHISWLGRCTNSASLFGSAFTSVLHVFTMCSAHISATVHMTTPDICESNAKYTKKVCFKSYYNANKNVLNDKKMSISCPPVCWQQPLLRPTMLAQ